MIVAANTNMTDFYDQPTSLKYKKLSSWRTNIPARAAFSAQTSDAIRKAKGVITNSVVIPDKAKWINSMVECPDAPLLCVSTGSKQNNVYFIRYKESVKSSNDGEQTMFEMNNCISSTYPVVSMDWVGDTLAFGCMEGYLDTYKVTESIHGSSKVKLEFKNRFSHLFSGSTNNITTPPGRLYQTKRVNEVMFHANDPNIILCSEGSNLRIWDLNRNDVPLASCRVSDEVNKSAQWSSINPHLICVAGVDRAIAVLDSRIMGINYGAQTNNVKAYSGGSTNFPSPVAYFQYGAHNDCINKVRWSPFVPYWIASSGNDGVVKVWDLRFNNHTAVAVLDHPETSVRCVNWSKTHGDYLYTGTAEGTWRTWSLKSDEYYLSKDVTSSSSVSSLGGKIVAECGDDVFASGVENVLSSNKLLNTSFAVSSTGELSAFTLNEDLLFENAEFKYQTRDRNEEEYDLERLAYARKVRDAVRFVVEWGKDQRNEDKLDEGLLLLEKCLPLKLQDTSFEFQKNTTEAKPDQSKLTKLENWKEIFASVVEPIDVVANLYFDAKYTGGNSVDDLTEGNYRIRNLQKAYVTSNLKFSSVLSTFQQDLQLLANHLPPHFFSSIFGTLQDDLKIEFDAFEQRLKLLDFVCSGGESENLTQEFVEKTIRLLYHDPTNFSNSLLKRVVETELNKNYMEGLELGKKVLEVYESYEKKSEAPVKFRHYSSIAHLLLFPTVYDDQNIYDVGRISDKPTSPTKSTTLKRSNSTKSNNSLRSRSSKKTMHTSKPSLSLATPMSSSSSQRRKLSSLAKESAIASASTDDVRSSEDDVYDFDEEVEVSRISALDTLLKNSKLVMPMVRLECKIQRILHRFHDQTSDGPSNVQAVSQKIIEAFKDEKTISISANKAFMNACLLVGKFDKYSDHLLEILATFQGNDSFIQTLLDHFERVAVARFSKFLNEFGNRNFDIHSAGSTMEYTTNQKSQLIDVFTAIVRMLVNVSKNTHGLLKESVLQSLLTSFKNFYNKYLLFTGASYDSTALNRETNTKFLSAAEDVLSVVKIGTSQASERSVLIEEIQNFQNKLENWIAKHQQ